MTNFPDLFLKASVFLEEEEDGYAQHGHLPEERAIFPDYQNEGNAFQ